MVFFFTVPAYAEDAYICFRDKATGFAYDRNLKEWVITDSKKDRKYIVSRINEIGKTWEVKRIGSDHSLSICMDDFNSAGVLFCDGVIEFKMNKINLRYILTYDIGYYYSGKGMKDPDEQSGTPYLEIGKCHPVGK